MMAGNEDGPTLGEVARLVEAVARQLAELTARLDSTYLRKDVADANRAADLSVMGGLRTDLDAIVEQGRQTRRLYWTTIAAPVLVGVITAILLLAIPR